MLGKLIKHEFLADGRLLFPVYIVVLVLSLLGRFSTWLATRQSIADAVSTSFASILEGLASLLSVLYVIAFIAAMVLTIFYLIYRFYKNFFTDEGYLMMTLPTKSYTLVTAKFINSVIWVVIGLAVTLVSLYITFSHYDQLIDTVSQIYNLLTRSGDKEYLKDALGTEPGVFIAELVFYAIVWFARFIITWYFAIAFGQLLSKNHKVAGAIGAYLLLSILSDILNTIFLWFENQVLADVITGYSTSTGVALQTTLIGTSVVSIVVCAVLFWATCYIMEHRLNLD
jgi:hypothetical protein